MYKDRSGARLCVCIFAGCSLVAAAISNPSPLGKLVDLGGHRLHVNCTGQGNPIVVIENGLGDFSFDWSLVQAQVANFTRVCSYDRAGYAWSDPGPKPRTFLQLNLELSDALSKLGEKGPFVLVGHSYGGPVARNFATAYAGQVAGMVLVDAAFEGLRVGIGGKATMRLGEDAKGRTVPPARENMTESDKPAMQMENKSSAAQILEPMYKVLSPRDQELQLWAQPLPEMEDAETSQREWSSEYFAKWLSTPQDGTLGKIPLIVLTRAEGGYREGETDIPAAQMERERKQGQEMLVRLSRNGRQIIVHSGHNMELEAPDKLSAAIREVVEAVRGPTR